MNQIKSPEQFARMGNPFVFTLFLAGGITGTPDWQADLVAKIGNAPLVFLNPRRDSFDINDPPISEQQITWEYVHLRRANAICFWFPKESVCPIALFEYGYWLGGRKPLFVGCDPEYPRKFDRFVSRKPRRFSGSG